MRTAHYLVTKHPGGITVRATDIDAKQAFFGWGSDRDAIDGSFYGRAIEGRGYGDRMLWEWKLSHDGVLRMIHNISAHIDDPNYYAGREAKIARELLRVLRRAEGLKR